MTTHPDLAPAAERLTRLVASVPDDALDRPTPCEHYTVGDLIEHIGGFALGFTAAAVKRPLGRAPSGDISRLPADWRTRIPADLRGMAEAWADPEAWTGMTAAGGVDLPGEGAGVVGLDELVVHGWDLARATGQPSGYEGPGLEAIHGFVQQFQGIDGVFGPPVDVEVADDEPFLHRILVLAGRDPAWAPPAG